MADPTSEDFLREIDELLQGDDLPPVESLKTKPNGISSESSDIITERPKTRADALKAALAAHEDLEVIRGLCEGGKIPDHLRAELWKECLNVSRRPDALGGWTGPLDCENQETIHAQCVEQAAKLGLEHGPQEQVVMDMEQVITFYCKSRNLRYATEGGWPELLLPFVALGMPRADLFNCFYAMMGKYIPRDCKADGRPFHLFRLLLLYHDPELCSYLDTKKLAPDTYLQPWLRSLYASTCELAVVRTMWDHYFLERDPFLVFFQALVMIVNAKELVMESGDTSHEELCSTLSSLPCQLSSEDIEDFLSLAKYYASRTPQSFRKDYHSLLYGSGRSVSSIATSVSHALCLPISLQEVMEINYSENAEASGMQYFLVDCRPVEHFSCGHLPKSYHLDANLLLHSPDDFAIAADRLCSKVKEAGVEGGEHLCFFGSGREQEDQYVNMVVAKFLQKSVAYVSLARGGFLEMKSLLGGRLAHVLEDYDVHKCQELYSESGYTSSARSDTSGDSDSEADRQRQRLQAKGARLYAHLTTGGKERLQRFRARVKGFWNSPKKQEEKHVQPLERPGKRYRNAHADVFVIADEDEENENATPSSSEDEVGQEMVNISLFTTNPDILHSFPCIEIKESAETCPGHLLLTSDSLIAIRELSDRAGWARVKHKHRLDSIIKITAKKRHPDIITFKFGTGTGEEAVITHKLSFRIPNTHKCTDAIKTQIWKVQDRYQ